MVAGGPPSVQSDPEPQPPEEPAESAARSRARVCAPRLHARATPGPRRIPEVAAGALSGSRPGCLCPPRRQAGVVSAGRPSGGCEGDASRAGDTGSASQGSGHSVESAAQEARIVASGAPAGPPGAADSLPPWRESLPQDLGRRGACARAVCVRHPPAPPDPAVLLWGSPCQPPKDR